MDCRCKPEIKQKIDSLHSEIYGNGNSSKSLITRMAKVETNMKLLEDKFHTKMGSFYENLTRSQF